MLLERRGQRVTHGILDEPGLQVGVLDDEQFVRTLQQLVNGRAHRALHDVDEMLGVDASIGPDEQRAATPLVVGCERDELEDPLDVRVVEPGLEQAVGGGSAYEPLCAGARHDPPRLDADHAPYAPRRGAGNSDQRRDLLGREAGHGCAARERVLSLDANLGTECLLTVDDVARDVLGQGLHQERLADHHLVDRLPEQLGEARHVDALLRGIEVDRAGDLRRKRLLVPLVPDPDRLLDAGHAGSGQAELDLRLRRLQVDRQSVPEVCHRVQP